MPIPIFHRYIIRETLSIFAATCLILLTVIVSFRLTNLLDSVVAGNISLSAVWQIITFQAVRFLFLLMPLSLILAIAITMGRLYSEQELPAALACGISQKHVGKALLALSIPIACIVALGNLFILPEVYTRQSIIRDQAEQEAALLILRPNEFRYLGDGTVIFTSQVNQARLGSFFLYHHTNGEHNAIIAQNGHFSSDSNGKYLNLGKGIRSSWIENFPVKKTQFTSFNQGKLRLPDSRTHSRNRLRNLPLDQLPNTAQGLAEWQHRLNPAVALVLFSALMPFLTKTKPRSSRYQKLMPIFLLFAVYLNSLDTVTTAIKNHHISPWPGSIWIHLCLVVLLAITCWFRYPKKGLS